MLRLLIASTLLLSACHRSHADDPISLPPLDAGPDDGAPGSASDSGPGLDAGSSDSGLGNCLPSTLESFSPADRPMTFGGGGSTLWLAHLHADPNPCDGACSALLEVGRTGVPELSPVYWSHHYGPLTLATDARRAVAFTFDPHVEDPILHWQRLPRTAEGWMRNGEAPIPEGSTFVGAALGSGEVLYLAFERSTEAGPDVSILEVGGEGASVREVEFASAIGARRSARMLSRRASPSLPWLISIQDWDFPPTVQIESGDGSGSFNGSSCGVDDYDVADLGDDTLAVIQRCGSLIELEPRVGVFGPPVVLTERAADVAPSIVALGPNRVALAYIERGAAAPVYEERVLVGDEWRLDERVMLPTDAELTLPLLEVDVAATAGGETIGVAWRGTPPSEPFFERAEGRIARIGPCI